ncbi:MAG: MBL fold metallo-hydrolase [Deltaproteobacteria bacterium]|nr:MBL fold metallo-hydrolase [Deltaproteobacteria bacterium]
MSIDELFPGIFKIEVPLPRNPLRMLNAYLIKGEKRHLLIDNGFNRPECLEAMNGALDSLGVARGDLDFFLTHLHADHCGLTADLCEGGETKIYASALDGESINNTTRGPSYWTGFLRTMIPHGFSEEQVAELSKTHPAIRFCPSHELDFITVAPGEKLQYGGYTLRILDGKGHTPGLLALYEPSNKILFSSDLILGDITPNIARWPNVRDSLGDFFDSLAAVEALDVALTLPAHRSLVPDTKKRIHELYEHHKRRLDEVRTLLKEGPQQGYPIATRMTWDMRGEWEDFPVAQKWFACGEALSHLDRLVALGDAEERTRGDTVVFALRQ